MGKPSGCSLSVSARGAALRFGQADLSGGDHKRGRPELNAAPGAWWPVYPAGQRGTPVWLRPAPSPVSTGGGHRDTDAPAAAQRLRRSRLSGKVRAWPEDQRCLPPTTTNSRVWVTHPRRERLPQRRRVPGLVWLRAGLPAVVWPCSVPSWKEPPPPLLCQLAATEPDWV